MTNKELITRAASVIRTRKTKDALFGDVGSAVLSESGKVYVGICAGVPANGVCAERVALGSMITAGEYKFKRIVATWKDEEGAVFVIPPCGNCRQFMQEIDEENLSAEVILDMDKAVSLKELLPYYDWWKRQDGL
jgi:cytidine deaminase